MTTSVLIASGKAAEAAAPFPVLTWLILLPLFGSLAVAVLSNRRPEYIKLTAALVSVATGALSLWMLGQFSSHDGDSNLCLNTTGFLSGAFHGTWVLTESRCSWWC